MRLTKVNIFFFLLIVLAVVALAFEEKIRAHLGSYGRLSLSSFKLETLIGYPTKIQEGYQGYVIFYADLEGCKACLSRIGIVKEVSSSYDEVGFYAILKGRTTIQSFGEHMARYDFPGEYIVDADQILRQRLGLSDHPMLLFFNRDSQLLACLPMDVQHDSLKRLMYRYLGEM